MAFFLNKTTITSHFRFSSQKTDGALALPRRGYHVDLGDREKALLAEDPTLRKFKSEKTAVRRIKRISDGLTIAIVAGCAYEFYVRTVVREEARKQAGEKA